MFIVVIIRKVYNWWKHEENATVHGAIDEQTDIPNDPRNNPTPSMSPEMMPASKDERSVAPARNTNGLIQGGSFPMCKAY